MRREETAKALLDAYEEVVSLATDEYDEKRKVRLEGVARDIRTVVFGGMVRDTMARPDLTYRRAGVDQYELPKVLSVDNTMRCKKSENV